MANRCLASGAKTCHAKEVQHLLRRGMHALNTSSRFDQSNNAQTLVEETVKEELKNKNNREVWLRDVHEMEEARNAGRVPQLAFKPSFVRQKVEARDKTIVSATRCIGYNWIVSDWDARCAEFGQPKAKAGIS